MKLFYILSFLFAYSLNGITQINNSLIVVDVRIPGNTTTFNIELVRESPSFEILDKRHINNNSSIAFSLPCFEPFWTSINIKNEKDSSITNASLFLVTKDTIKVIFNSQEPPGIVVGGENDFINKNRYLLFDLPWGIFLSDYRNEIRKVYNYQTTSSYLYPRVNEYLDNTSEMLQHNKSSYFVLEQFYQKRENFPLAFLDSSVQQFDASLQKTENWKNLILYIAREKQLLRGKKITKLNIQDTSLHVENLEILYSAGKYIYVDFWASWCKPCREDMKNLKKLYKELDTSRLKIVSISIDDERDRWLKANDEEMLPWKSYIDYAKECVSKLNITSIPQAFIIDQQGKIVDRFIRTDGLREFARQNHLIKKLN